LQGALPSLKPRLRVDGYTLLLTRRANSSDCCHGTQPCAKEQPRQTYFPNTNWHLSIHFHASTALRSCPGC
jgi:hypothetical protein